VIFSAALAGALWAPLVLLLVFNLPHLGVRGWGIAAGLARGRGVLAVLQRRHFSRSLPALAGAAAALGGFLVSALAAQPAWRLLQGSGLRASAAAAGVFAFFLALLSSGMRPERLLGAIVLAAVAAGALRAVLAP